LDDLYTAFSKFDVDSTGSIGKSDFARFFIFFISKIVDLKIILNYLRCLTKCGVKFKSGVERDFIDTISTDARTNSVNYRDFIDAITTELRLFFLLIKKCLFTFKNLNVIIYYYHYYF
jgi:Ca2+-binding EF-hand superfamily protein